MSYLLEYQNSQTAAAAALDAAMEGLYQRIALVKGRSEIIANYAEVDRLKLSADIVGGIVSDLLVMISPVIHIASGLEAHIFVLEVHQEKALGEIDFEFEENRNLLQTQIEVFDIFSDTLSEAIDILSEFTASFEYPDIAEGIVKEAQQLLVHADHHMLNMFNRCWFAISSFVVDANRRMEPWSV
ncbi:MAG: hypothetical protein EOP10_26055 [Proteobacteria bacterium]|nr:MAG: hypothetical protein EOP10_26055 [Pseudomonadota bacterium]